MGIGFSVAAEVSAASTQRIWGMSISQKPGQILSWLVIFLAVSASYLYAFPQPNISYAVIVALHAAAGVLATILIISTLFRLLRNGSVAAKAGWSLIAAGAL